MTMKNLIKTTKQEALNLGISILLSKLLSPLVNRIFKSNKQ